MGLIRDVCLAAWEAVILPLPPALLHPGGGGPGGGAGGVEKLEKGTLYVVFVSETPVIQNPSQ